MIYHGDIFYCKDLTDFIAIKDGYIIVDAENRIVDVCSAIPERYEREPVRDHNNKLIIPAFCDIHLHSSQLVNTGLGYDFPFEEWLIKYTNPAERQYADLAKAEAINKRLINQLWYYGSMHSVIMGSTDALSALNLMKHYDKSGMRAYIGKMNADVAAFGDQAEDSERSVEETRLLAEEAKKLSDSVFCCVSPEFVPNCSDRLLMRLGELAVEYSLPVQSHLSEGEADVQAVKDRYPELSYSQVYLKYQLFGQTSTVMAHAIYTSKEERTLIKERNVTVAHCPIALSNIPSGKTMPLREFLEDGVNIGLGSDIGGGHTLNMMRVIEQTVHYSKFQQFIDGSKPLSILEAFALATLGGGKVFGEVGSFQPRYHFDALVIDDEELSPEAAGYDIKERVERFLYEGNAGLIQERYCHGKKVDKPFPDIIPK